MPRPVYLILLKIPKSPHTYVPSLHLGKYFPDTQRRLDHDGCFIGGVMTLKMLIWVQRCILSVMGRL